MGSLKNKKKYFLSLRKPQVRTTKTQVLYLLRGKAKSLLSILRNLRGQEGGYFWIGKLQVKLSNQVD